MKAVAALMLMTAVVFAAGCNKPEDEPNNETVVTVTTITPSDITTTTAVCGATVVVSEGVTLEELGVCWGLQANPTASEEHLSTAQWNEPFTCTLTELNHNTVYHVRAYAKQGSDYYYGADKTFTTEQKPRGNGTYNGHDYIDLVFVVYFSQSLCVKVRHLIRPVTSRLGGMRPRINSEAIGPVNADGSANAEDRMTASGNDTVVRDAAEALVLDPLLLEIRRIVVIAPDHYNPVVRLNKPT